MLRLHIVHVGLRSLSARRGRRCARLAVAPLEAEEAGKSFPRRMFKKFFKAGSTDGAVVDALPAESSVKET